MTVSGGRTGIVATVLAVAVVVGTFWFSAEDPGPSAPAGNAARGTNVVQPNSPLSEDELESFLKNDTGTQYTFLRLSDGYHKGSPTERYARPALSLIKLYIAQYVLEQGDGADVAEALEMIRSSDDSAADDLFARYPDSIEWIATKYGLLSTRPNYAWGYSVTSTYDVVRFIATLMTKDPDSPLLKAMRHSETFAADGYVQNYGTATLPGAIGSKWGWSNDLTLHSSVSFGKDWVAAAAVTGSADDLTAVCHEYLGPLVGANLVLPTVAVPKPTGTLLSVTPTSTSWQGRAARP